VCVWVCVGVCARARARVPVQSKVHTTRSYKNLTGATCLT
jgi:hypothetical protein